MRVYNFPSDEIHIKNNKGEELAKIGPDGVEIDGTSFPVVSVEDAGKTLVVNDEGKIVAGEAETAVAAYPINCSVILDGSTMKFLCEKTFADETELNTFLADSSADYFQKGFFNFAVTVTASDVPSDVPVGYKFIAFATALDPDEGFISQVNTYFSGVLTTTNTNTYDSTFGFRFDISG